KPSLPSKLDKFWAISASRDHRITRRETKNPKVPPAEQERQDHEQAPHRSGDAVIRQFLQRLHFVEDKSREGKNLVRHADDRRDFERRKPDGENINGRGDP